ncbi:MAG: retroviral-like aspartic protease family protein [Treponema sp.]|nr:retroviral-like aspartic protease family protein [Treponema sp.]
MKFNAITVHLPDKQKQSILFQIQLGVPVPIDGYPQESRISMNSIALVDTGATGSCISRRFAADTQLKPFKMGTVIGAHGIAIVPVYRLDVLLPNGILFTNMEVAEFFGNNDFDFIIGMNILRMGDMALTNAKGKSVFSFRIPPANEHIDFTKA